MPVLQVSEGMVDEDKTLNFITTRLVTYTKASITHRIMIMEEHISKKNIKTQ